jgi:5-methylcytosine-specific restriction protein A
MTAIILGWNPDRWNQWNYPAIVDRVAETGLHVQPWGVGRHRNIPAGTEAWLLLQGRHGRGLIGHGVVVSEQPEPGQPEQPEPGTTMFVSVAFDALLPLGEQVAVDVLKEGVPGVLWTGVHGSGLVVDPADEAKIRGLWREFGPPPGPDPTQPVPGTYPEGAITRVVTNRYEQNLDARRACIAHHGTSCAACGFSFELTYGDAGKDFIDVHHLVPVSRLGSGYELDPVTDLVPLCANCHAMAHLGVGTPRTVAELRRIIAGAGFLAGATVSAGELEAQREAQRILEQQ